MDSTTDRLRISDSAEQSKTGGLLSRARRIDRIAAPKTAARPPAELGILSPTHPCDRTQEFTKLGCKRVSSHCPERQAEIWTDGRARSSISGVGAGEVTVAGGHVKIFQVGPAESRVQGRGGPRKAVRPDG